MQRTFIWVGLFVGSTIGGFVPALWGGSLISFSGVFFSFIGGLLGIWLGYKIGNSL